MNLKRYLLAGIAAAVPLFVTIYVLLVIIQTFDGISQPLVSMILGRRIPGLGLLVTLGTLMILGWFVSFALGKKTADYFDSIMRRIPLSRSIYSVTKNVIDTFLSERREFGKVVMVKMMEDAYTIGFLTGRAPKEVELGAGARLSSVFIPTSPNPTTGVLLMVSEDRISPLDMTFDKGMELVVSVGMARSDAGEGEGLGGLEGEGTKDGLKGEDAGTGLEG